MKALFLAICYLFLSSLILKAQSEVERQSVEIDGVERSWVQYVPEAVKESGEAVPVVILLHGRTGTGEGTVSATEMNPVAEENGFIVLYPDGLKTQWNYVYGIEPYPDEGDPDDTVFLKVMVNKVAESYPIDRDRIYVGGISNGGYMTQRLACLESDYFAGFASVVGTMFWGLRPLCEDGRPVNMLMMNGTADTINPWIGVKGHYEGQEIDYLEAVDKTAIFWAVHNHCELEFEEKSIEKGDEANPTQVFIVDFPCEKGDVVLYIIDGGGHTWPGVDWHNKDFLGETNFDIHAAEVIWEFFDQHRLSDTLPEDE